MNTYRMLRSRLALVAVLLLSSVPLAAACDDQSGDAEVCNGLDDLSAALRSIVDVDPDNAREDLQDVRSDVESAVTDIREAAADLPEVQALEDAWNSFSAAFQQIPESPDIGQAIRDLGTEITDLAAALGDVRAAVDC